MKGKPRTEFIPSIEGSQESAVNIPEYADALHDNGEVLTNLDGYMTYKGRVVRNPRKLTLPKKTTLGLCLIVH